jgi:hypothetical protein
MKKQIAYKYLNHLKNDIYKILPLIEEGNEFVDIHTKKIINKLNGLLLYYESLKQEMKFLSLLITMYSIYDDIFFEDIVHEDIRRKVLECLNLVDKIIKGVEEG